MKFYAKEKFNKRPDAVIFDLDNTLYPYEPAHRAAINAVKEKSTKIFSVSEENFDKAFAEAQKQTKECLGNTASSHSRLLYFQRMLELMGLGTQILTALDFEQTYWRTFLANAILFDEVKEFLDDLRLLDIPKAIVTDLTAQIQFRKIIYFGLDHSFDYIVTSEETGCDKPDSASFKLCLEKLHLKGSSIWMIGDDLEKDIQGARDSINAITLLKQHRGVIREKNKNRPSVSFEEYSDLRKLLKSIEK